MHAWNGSFDTLTFTETGLAICKQLVTFDVHSHLPFEKLFESLGQHAEYADWTKISDVVQVSFLFYRHNLRMFPKVRKTVRLYELVEKMGNGMNDDR